MEKMKQNKNTSAVIRVASATLAAVFLMCSLAIPTFADSLNGVDFNNQPLPYASFSTTDVEENGMLIGYSDSLPIHIACQSDQSTLDIYAFCITPSSGSSLYPLITCFSSSSGLTTASYYAVVGNGSVRGYNINTLSEDYSLYYHQEQHYMTNPLIPQYATIDDGLYAVSELISSGGGGGSTVAEFNYSIKPGYALFIDIHGLSDVSGTLFTNTSAAYASPHTSNQTLSYQSSLPSGNVSPQGNGINWQGTGNRDLFGRYKSWNRSLIIQPNSHYIAIYNPVHINTYVDPEHEDFNGNISVHVNKAYSETSILIPLNTELTGTGTVGTNTTDEQKPVVYDENTNSWIPQNSDGTPYTESPYGDYMPSTVNSIHDWLQNIANLISGFFNGAIGAVTTLVGAGSAFINQLVSLYSWLPAPVYAVLSSALILVITIGVIKVFI